MRKRSQQIIAISTAGEPIGLTRAILDFVSHVPTSAVDCSVDSAETARGLSRSAARRAALAAGSLALPPGPLGWVTMLPEMITIWKIQGQLVSDIAAAYGRYATLGREQMMWCLFRHTAAQAFRDLVVRLGDRLIFRRMSQSVAQRVARQVGLQLGRRTVGKSLSRWLPVAGAIGVGAYAYYDTIHVATTAIELFSSDAVIEDADAASTSPEDAA